MFNQRTSERPWKGGQGAPSVVCLARESAHWDDGQGGGEGPRRRGGGGGKAPGAKRGRRAEGRAADPTRGGDLRVCAGVALRRLPRRLGVDAGDDMALAVPARQTRGHGAAPASGRSAATHTPRGTRRGYREESSAPDARGSRAAPGGLHSEGRATAPREPGTRFPAGRAVVTAPGGASANHSGASARLRLREAPLRTHGGD